MESSEAEELYDLNPSRKGTSHLPVMPPSTKRAAPANTNAALPLYGSLQAPVHKSDIGNLVGQFGCLERMKLLRELDADREPSEFVSGRAAAGTATHETIARALRSPVVRKQILAGDVKLTRAQVDKVFVEEWDRAVAGRTVSWSKTDQKRGKFVILSERMDQCVGVFQEMHKHVAEVIAVEASFIAPIGDGLYIGGALDLIYRPHHTTACAWLDWKTGKLPTPFVLEHGFETGFYSHALKHGQFIANEPGAERLAGERKLIELIESQGGEVKPTYGEYPCEASLVELGDFVPYQRGGTKDLTDPIDWMWAGLPGPGKWKYAKGDLRGPGWRKSARLEGATRRLAWMTGKAVELVRSGLSVPNISDECSKCPVREQCLAQGHGFTGEQASQLESSIDALGGVFDDFEI